MSYLLSFFILLIILLILISTWIYLHFFLKRKTIKSIDSISNKLEVNKNKEEIFFSKNDLENTKSFDKKTLN